MDLRVGCILVAIADQFRPITDGGSHASGVYVVELLAVSPFSLDVVNLEADVGRHPVTVNIVAPPHRH